MQQMKGNRMAQRLPGLLPWEATLEEPDTVAEPAPPVPLWQQGPIYLRTNKARLLTYAARAGLFVAGVVATFVAILLYHVAVPDKPPLTQDDVKTSIASAFASVTPAPAYSAQ